MKLIKPLLILFLTTISLTTKSQTYESRSRVHIPTSAIIIRDFKVKYYDTIKAGFVVKQEETKNNGDVAYTISKVDSLRRDSIFLFKKNVSKVINGLGGSANLYVDEKDKSIIHVNYWLNPENKISIGTKISIRSREYTIGDSMIEQRTTRQLRSDTTVRLWLCNAKDTTTDWFKFSDRIIEAYDNADSTKILYYLVNKYDNDADYTIKLDNRDYLSYDKTAFEYGPIIIPFKFRFGYSKGGKTVDEEFSADLNIGVYYGYKLGKYRVRYEGSSLVDLPSISVSLGGFLNLSTASLDSVSTTAGKSPFTTDQKATIGIISPGVCAMVNFYNFQIGAFVGIDAGFGSNAKNWNFNNRPWLGFGLAYNISGFFKK